MTRPIARIDDEIGMNTTTTISELSDYVDTGELRPQDDVDERTFVGYRDRAKLVDDRGPPFFSGREHEINVFRRMLEDVSGGIPADSTVVVEGPPGAGKTALMAQCIGEVVACPRTNAEERLAPCSRPLQHLKLRPSCWASRRSGHCKPPLKANQQAAARCVDCGHQGACRYRSLPRPEGSREDIRSDQKVGRIAFEGVVNRRSQCGV